MSEARQKKADVINDIKEDKPKMLSKGQAAMLKSIVRQTYRIVVVGAVCLALFISSNIYLGIVQTRQLNSTMYLNQYRLGSKTLTSSVQSYAVTGNNTYYNDYMKELNQDKNRDIAWEGLEKCG